MRAVVCEALAEDYSRVALKDVPLPQPGPGEARVKVEAASLNFPDLLMLKGQYQFKPDPPFTVGMDLAGVVDAVGPSIGNGVTLKPGTRVAGGAKTGAFADYAVCPAANLHVVPVGMAAPMAAAYPAAYVTAYASTSDLENSPTEDGDTWRTALPVMTLQAPYHLRLPVQ